MNELSMLISKARDVIPDAIKEATVRTVMTAVAEAPRYSGQLRGSMRVGFKSPDLSKVIAPVYFFDAVPDAERISLQKAQVAVSTFTPGDTIYISNDQDYAADQEYEAGHLFLTKASRKFAQHLDEAVDAAQ